jgi:hypothetical protein
MWGGYPPKTPAAGHSRKTLQNEIAPPCKLSVFATEESSEWELSNERRVGS